MLLLSTAGAFGGRDARADAAVPMTRQGLWSLGASLGIATAAAGDLNRRLELENLAFASGLEDFDTYREAGGDLRYGLAERLSLEARFGYWWRAQESGRITRRVSALPVVAGVIYHAWSSSRARAGPFAAAGLLLGAKLSGEDPLGGVDRSGTGTIFEGGIEAEYFLAETWSVRLRGVARRAVARDVLGPGQDFDLSGAAVQAGLQVYFRR